MPATYSNGRDSFGGKVTHVSASGKQVTVNCEGFERKARWNNGQWRVVGSPSFGRVYLSVAWSYRDPSF
jgi:hypothetical protein